MKIAFRADASVAQGTGHVVRTLTLAREFQKSGHHVRMISSIEELSWLTKMVKASGIEVETCKPHTMDQSWASGGVLDLLVIDSYEIPADQIKDISRHVLTMAIVDNDERGLKPTFLLDHNLDAEKYPLGFETNQFIGPSFALVRDEIRDVRRTSSVRVNENSKPVVLVMIGGADHAKIAISLAKMLASLDGEFEIHFVTSDINIKQISSYLPNNSSNIHPLVPDIHDYLKEVDVVISAAGTSTLDLSCVGIPSIFVAVVENQFRNLLAISKLETGFALGRFDEIQNKQKELIDRIYLCAYDENIREKFFRSSQLLVDGHGATRVVNEIENLTKTSFS